MGPSLPPPDIDEPRIDYVLDGDLDPSSQTVRGSAKISFVNTTARALEEIWLHLYLNAFENSRTVFLRPQPDGSWGSRSQRHLRRPGELNLSSMTSPHYPGVSLLQTTAPHSPEDPFDRTDIRVELPTPLERGEALELEIEFNAKLPNFVERTGYEGDFFFVAQWYPKLARLDRSGVWEHFTYHPLAEFSANFGKYSATISAPTGFVLGSNGQRTSREQDGNRVVERSVATNVTDFVFCAWPGFAEETRSLGSTEVRYLFPASGHDPQETWSGVEASLAYFEKRYGQYAHETLTIVSPPQGADPAFGMEYPGLFTTGSMPWLQRLGVRAESTVVAHELAHQWFPFVVQSSEYQTPFLDESIASFLEGSALDAAFGPTSAVSSPFVQVSSWAFRRYRALGVAPQSALLAAKQYRGMNELSRLIYSRAPLALETIARSFGRERLEGALRVYLERFRFRYAGEADFWAVMNAELGASETEVLRRLLEGAHFDITLGDLETNADNGAFITTIRIERDDDLALPVLAQVTLKNGEMKEQLLAPEQREWRFPHTEPLTRIILDPHDALLLESNRLNNRRYLAPEPGGRLAVHGLLTLSLVTTLLSLLL